MKLYYLFFSVGVCASILWSSSSVYSGQYQFGCRPYRHHDQTSHYFPYCSKKRKGLWTCNSSQVASRYVLVFFNPNICTSTAFVTRAQKRRSHYFEFLKLSFNSSFMLARGLGIKLKSGDSQVTSSLSYFQIYPNFCSIFIEEKSR